MSVYVEEGKFYIGLTVDNVVNMCECLPEWKNNVWDELPQPVKQKVAIATCSKNVQKKTHQKRGVILKELLSFVGEGKTKKEIHAHLNSLGCTYNDMNLCGYVDHGYLLKRGRGFYIVTDKGYKKLKLYNLVMNEKDALVYVLSLIQKNGVRISTPELVSISDVDGNRCRKLLVKIREHIDNDLLPGYHYQNLYDKSVRSFYVYWYEK